MREAPPQLQPQQAPPHPAPPVCQVTGACLIWPMANFAFALSMAAVVGASAPSAAGLPGHRYAAIMRTHGLMQVYSGIILQHSAVPQPGTLDLSCLCFWLRLRMQQLRQLRCRSASQVSPSSDGHAIRDAGGICADCAAQWRHACGGQVLSQTSPRWRLGLR